MMSQASTSSRAPKGKSRAKPKLSNAAKRNKLIKRVDAQMMYAQLTAMIIIDLELSWWYCTMCRAAGKKQCGMQVCNTCETRAIVSHLTSCIHLNVIKKDRNLHKLDQQRDLKQSGPTDTADCRASHLPTPAIPSLSATTSSSTTCATPTAADRKKLQHTLSFLANSRTRTRHRAHQSDEEVERQPRKKMKKVHIKSELPCNVGGASRAFRWRRRLL